MECRHVLHTVGREVGPLVELGSLSSADSGSSARRIVYPRTEMLLGLAARLNQPVNGWSATEHPAVYTTAELAERVTLGDDRANWTVPLCRAVQLPEQSLPIAPYTLGAWLGDGDSLGSRIASVDPEIPNRIAADGYTVTRQTGINYGFRLPRAEVVPRSCAVCGGQFAPKNAGVQTCGRRCGSRFRDLGTGPEKLQSTSLMRCPDCEQPYAGGQLCETCRHDHGSMGALLRSVGVLGDKHIPSSYLRSSERQRRALLAGLLDTDGTVGPGGQVEFAVTNEKLALGTVELLTSLGYRPALRTRYVRGRRPDSSICYTVSFGTVDDVFSLTRKRQRHAELRSPVPVRTAVRYIVSITPVEAVPVRCVQVDNADHSYLCTAAMVPTHNSTLALDLARSASIKNGLTSAIFSLEMSQIEITMRLLSAEAQIPLNHIRNGTMNDDDWSRMAKKMGEVSEAPLFIDDSPNLTMMEIRAKARRLRQRHDLKLVVIDYIQLMTSGKKVESRQLEVSEFSRQLKLLAKELGVPVVALSQLNRGPELRTDKKPMLSDLRESGSLEQDADMVILLHRPDLYDKESERAGEADMIVAKHRNGPTKDITVAFQGHYSRFADMQF